MNKIFKYSLAALVLAMGMTSCSDSDDNYEPATVSGPQVFFSNQLQSQYEISNTATSFTIPVSRYVNSGTLTVPLEVSQSSGSIFSLPASVTFADGETMANVTVSYNPDDIEYGKYDTITVKLPATVEGNTITTNYGKSEYQFTAGITEWVKMKGQGSYREDLFTGVWGISNQVWAVDVYESAISKGRYLVKAPYSPSYGFRYSDLWDDDEEIEEYYAPEAGDMLDMVLDASDPDFVIMEPFESGFADLTSDPGKLGFTSYVYYWLAGGNSLEAVKSARASYFGKLKDGVITFAPQTLLVTLNGDLAWYGNPNGLFAVALPGYAIADYSAEVSYSGYFTDVDNNVFAEAKLVLGDDAETVKAIVVSGDDDADAVADAIAAGDVEAIDVKAGAIRVPIDPELTGNLQLVIVVIDGEDVKTVATAEFEYYGGGAEPWESLGLGYYTDDIVTPLFTKAGKSVSYEVEIQENTNTPGVYRLVKLYAPVAAAFETEGGDKNIVVNAEEADGVYIVDQPIGLNFGYGDMSIETDGGYYTQKYGYDAVKAQLPGVFGTLKDGVITFPILEENDTEGNPHSYQAWLNMGDNSYFGGTNGEFQIVLPGASASVKAKARQKARATEFVLRLNGLNMKAAANGGHKVVRQLAKRRAF